MSQNPIKQTPLHEFLARADFPCPGCGYNLRGLTGTVCPECGRDVPASAAMDDEARITAEVVEYLRDHDEYCKGCDRNMRGQTSNRCPVCGAIYMLVGRVGPFPEQVVPRAFNLPGSFILAITSVIGVPVALIGIAGFLASFGGLPVSRAAVAAGVIAGLTPFPASLLWARRARRLLAEGRGPHPIETMCVHAVCIALILIAARCCARPWI